MSDLINIRPSTVRLPAREPLHYIRTHPITLRSRRQLGKDRGKILVIGEDADPIPPPSPANFAISDVYGTSFIWDAVEDSDGYNVYISVDGGDFVKHNSVIITELTYTADDLTTGAYEAYVTSKEGVGESNPSNTVSFSITLNSTDFSTYTDDTFPTGWKDIWFDSASFTWLVRHDHVGFEGEAVLEHNQPSNEYDAIIWHELGQFTDFQLLTFINPWVGGIFFAGMQGGVTFRCSDTDNTSKQGYTLGFRRRASAVDLITLQKWVGNSLSSLAGSTAGGAVDPLEDIIYGVRIFVEGERIRIRVWKQSDPEPDVWHIDVTDTGTVITTGYIGFTSSEGSSGTSGQWDADSIEIKTAQVT